MRTRSGAVADPQEQVTPREPFIFEWQENLLDEGLAAVHRMDIAERQKIRDVIREMDDSTMFARLFANYTDEVEISKTKGNDRRVLDAMEALLARIYIAGTLRGHGLIRRVSTV